MYQINYSKTEQEIIVLRAVTGLIDDMVNYQNFEKNHETSNAWLMPTSSTSKRLFNIMLVDFLSSPKDELFNLPKALKKFDTTDSTLMFYLNRICDGPSLNNESIKLRTPVIQFIDWLEEECFVENVYFPSINIETDICAKRLALIRICGNIAKHSFVRLEGVVKGITKVFEQNGHKIDLGQGFLVLQEFFDRFHDDIFAYHLGTIAEHLNNIRWGIYEYLQVEFSRSYERTPQYPVGYKFNYPNDCSQPLPKAMYYELMNLAKQPPYFPRFSITPALKELY